MSHREHAPDEDTEQFIAGLQSVESNAFDFTKQDPHADSIATVPELFRRSRQGIRYLPESHRGFLVVASAVVYDVSDENPRRGVYTAGNFKAKLRDDQRGPDDLSDIPKVCAEMDILIRAEQDGFGWVGAIVVAATINPLRIKKVTGVASATLHPCGECGLAFQNSDLFDEYTPIITTGSASEFKKYQLQSFRQYKKRYERYHGGEVFRDAPLRDYIPSEWGYRKDLYLRQVKREKIGGSVLHGSAKRERARRQLKLQVMSNPLEFSKSG